MEHSGRRVWDMGIAVHKDKLEGEMKDFILILIFSFLIGGGCNFPTAETRTREYLKVGKSHRIDESRYYECEKCHTLYLLWGAGD